MNAAVLAAGAHDAAPLKLGRDERLGTLFAPVRDMSSLMGLVVAGSVVAHVALVALAFVGSRAPGPAPKEIAVEIVQEVPKPPAPKPPPPQAAPPKPAEAVKPEPIKAPEPVKPPAPPKPAQMVKPPEPPPAAKPAPPKPAAEDLQKELEQLRAEQAALKSELAKADAAKPAPSGKAVALAATGDADGDPVGYQQLVFSQLAKAKDGDGFHGATGVTAVRFEIMDSGALAGVEIVTPSGDATLDQEALTIVRRAAPFPPPPKGADRTVFANVNFVPPRRP